MTRKLILLLAAIILYFCSASEAAGEPVRLNLQYPYSLNPEEKVEVYPGSTQLLYVSIENFNNSDELPVHTVISLPKGLTAKDGKGWLLIDGGHQIVVNRRLPADYGQDFEAIPVEASPDVSDGKITAYLEGDNFKVAAEGEFEVGNPAKGMSSAPAVKESWYIQGTALPVDESGNIDSRQSPGTIVVPDVTLENMKTRLTGGSAADWTALMAKPVSYILLDMRNPQKDQVTVHFRAELVDRGTGEKRIGLISCTGDEGPAFNEGDRHGTEAQFFLNGNKMQTVVIPIYADPFSINEGDYGLKITLNDGDVDKVTEIPLTVIKSRNVGIVSLGFALFCLLVVIFSYKRIRRTIIRIGARGDIAVSLFAAMAFGSVVVPVTLLGDFLHVILGPFSGLVTGLLSGVLQYLLLISLLVLFRKPGIAGLFYIIRWLLSAILFGRVTPVGILLCAVSVVVIETVLRISGFYRKQEISFRFGIFLSLLIGICDAGITFINMQQLMLFYRMYYADWFVGLYMVINGLLYSTIGSFLGFKMGSRLKQVMGS